eukprot:scaffold1160_cov261-Pinguiococcus_pyrenoidosus.AAC.8
MAITRAPFACALQNETLWSDFEPVIIVVSAVENASKLSRVAQRHRTSGRRGSGAASQGREEDVTPNQKVSDSRRFPGFGVQAPVSARSLRAKCAESSVSRDLGSL